MSIPGGLQALSPEGLGELRMNRHSSDGWSIRPLWRKNRAAETIEKRESAIFRSWSISAHSQSTIAPSEADILLRSAGHCTQLFPRLAGSAAQCSSTSRYIGVWTSGTTNAVLDVSSTRETAKSRLQVIVNGIASTAVRVTLHS